MQSLDYRVVKQALEWLEDGRTVWLCTVLSTFGSSPREPGSLMVATAEGEHVGSLSGGCVEEDFLARLAAGDYELPAVMVRYGDPEDAPANPRIRLPCGGILHVLVERMVANDGNRDHCGQILEAMRSGEKALVRQVRLTDGVRSLENARPTGPRVVVDEREETVCIRVGAISRLILAGYSTVAEACASLAMSLGYQVVLCDPREEVTANAQLPEGIAFEPVLPSMYISAEGACTSSTAVVATTHDPKIDDLAMMAAVKTPATYIGVMGSMKTSRARAERLSRTGGLSQDEINRIRMPIGLRLGSKTPAEIALAIMADIVRVRRGRDLDEL
ncbi:XdhC family protein [Marinobacter sp. M216]|uniref:XdhC family protein n=1 Tax=Marinobacter albus TaxID=3030833 RepID=A0ABT7HHJ4_9GAMM|nr:MULTISPECIES: XdhC family protein [unclassified Marinobacter]MBW7472420.1 XdhC family protein [Marinobacter sp. F4218]MDK9558970.1 XdhC family protein [Marinobacter sp. M216]